MATGLTNCRNEAIKGLGLSVNKRTSKKKREKSGQKTIGLKIDRVAL